MTHKKRLNRVEMLGEAEIETKIYKNTVFLLGIYFIFTNEKNIEIFSKFYLMFQFKCMYVQIHSE